MIAPKKTLTVLLVIAVILKTGMNETSVWNVRNSFLLQSEQYGV